MLIIFLKLSFLIATFVQLLFWLGLFSKLAFYSQKERPQKENDYPPVSIVLCARNAGPNLLQYLPRILNQNYPYLEIIVVNDNSTDNSRQIILDFQKKYTNLHLIEAQDETRPGKKDALTKGIRAASNELLLLTDTDCFPSTNLWVHSMVSSFQEESPIILGYGPYIKESSFLNYFIRFETIYTATQYFSFALAGKPYMGVGRNLVYTKSIFKKNRGFSEHSHIASGDDDLFISQAAKHAKVQINLSPDSFVYSIPKSSWKSYYNQKRRHISTATSYSAWHQWMLGFLAWSHWWHYLGAILLLWVNPVSLPLIAISYLVRIGVVSFQYWHIMDLLADPKLRYWTPFLDACYFLYYCLFAPALLISGSNYRTWT